MPHLRRPLTVLLLALALGVCADLLFYGRALGLSAPLFGGLVLAALAWLSRAEGRPASPANTWVGGAALLFAALVAIRASALLTALNTLAALGLLLLYAALFRAEGLSRLEGWRVAAGAAGAALQAAALPAPLGLSQAGRLGGLRVQLGALLVVGRGVLLAAPALLVFAGLLALADGIFASYLSDLLRFRMPFDLGAIASHGAVVLIVAWGVAGGLLVALRDHPAGAMLGPAPGGLPAEGETQRLRALRSPRVLGWGEALTVLVLVDGLFAAFMLVQGAYLFGGLDTLARTGLSFAAYARRGFFELVTVAVLALGLLWGLALVARRERPWQRRAFVAACALMVALVLGMLGSAALRMWLYEQAYGFTLLRLLTHSWMAWLAVVLLLLLASLLRERPRWFTLGLPAAAACYLLALNLLNPEAMIVRENLARYQITGDLDVDYLATLSPDATPALAAALALAGPHTAALAAHLDEQRQELRAAARAGGWPAWNLGRARALATLEGTNDEGRTPRARP